MSDTHSTGTLTAVTMAALLMVARATTDCVTTMLLSDRRCFT